MSAPQPAGQAALVVGQGSIGRRHAEVLGELGCSVAVLSRSAPASALTFRTLAEALAVHQPAYVVIANETAAHGATLAELAASGFDGTVVVEKPLFAQAAPLPANQFRAGYVAYNLRFHPVIMRLRSLLARTTVVAANVHVGQYLPSWRPDADYRQSYSASAAQGGGVLRDLSHELDYLAALLGPWLGVAALGGHFSALEIDSDDVFSLLMRTARCPALSLHLNYLDRRARRHLIINTASDTIEADLVAGTVRHGDTVESFSTERNTTYRAMHAAYLSGQAEAACTLAEGMATMDLIDAARTAAVTHQWILR